MVKLMRWPSWPSSSSNKFEIFILLQRLEGLENLAVKGRGGLLVEVTWKGQKGMVLSPLIRSNSTIEADLSSDGSTVEWNEEFRSFCNLSSAKDGSSNPWEILFTVLQKNQGPRDRVVIGSASLNLSEYASAADGNEIQIKLPLKFRGAPSLFSPSLYLCLSMVELRTAQKLSKTPPKSIVPVTRSPPSSVSLSKAKDEFSLKEGLKRVKIFRNCVSGGSSEEGCSKEEGRKTDQTSRDYHQFDIDFPNDSAEEESKGNMEFSNSILPFNYETLACANMSRQSSLSNTLINDKDEQWTYYGNVENSTGLFPDHLMPQNSNRKILSWRKLSFKKSTKKKGEPLLNKIGEEGGDDIDYYRRQLSSFEGSNFGQNISMFGEDNFSVGSWEEKEVRSRDGHLELRTKIFFASIDQRNERAAGESACTALVVVIADWLQSNRNLMPTKSEWDNLIREGSSEWRNLCKNEDYIEQFPDKHFDIDTILQAKIRPLNVIPDNSFVGFFNFEALEEGGCDFFQGAMSFDSIWDDIARLAQDEHTNGDPLIYIVSWNDHFFILKVENDAYYIIDTLGERLFEGCNEAYILKFDKDTTITKLSNSTEASNEKACIDKAKESSSESDRVDKAENIEVEEEIVRRGKESCKEYIKSFLAAIPIREAEADAKKGVSESTFIHRRLQIEFHRTLLTKPVEENLSQQAHENGDYAEEKS